MGRKKNIPIDVPTSAAQEGQGQPTGWAGVAEARWAPVKSTLPAPASRPRAQPQGIARSGQALQVAEPYRARAKRLGPFFSLDE